MHILRVFGCFHFIAKCGHEAGYMHTIGACGFGQRTGVDLDFQRGTLDRSRRDFGNDPQRALRLGQRPFDQQHRAQGSGVREQTPCFSGREKLCV